MVVQLCAAHMLHEAQFLHSDPVVWQVRTMSNVPAAAQSDSVGSVARRKCNALRRVLPGISLSINLMSARKPRASLLRINANAAVSRTGIVSVSLTHECKTWSVVSRKGIVPGRKVYQRHRCRIAHGGPGGGESFTYQRLMIERRQ